MLTSLVDTLQHPIVSTSTSTSTSAAPSFFVSDLPHAIYPEPAFLTEPFDLGGMDEHDFGDFNLRESREYMLVDVLVHSASGRISQAQLNSIISVMKEITPRAIPSLHQLHQFHQLLELTIPIFVPTLATTPSGRTLHRLKPQDALSLVSSTPDLRNSLTLYPEEPVGSISSINQAGKALDLPSLARSLMAKHAGLVYYIDELAESSSEGLLLVHWFFLRSSSLHLEALPVSQNGTLFSYGSDSFVIPISHLVCNAPLLLRHFQRDSIDLELSTTSPKARHYSALNPLCIVAGDKMWYTVPIAVFADDLSGTGSKRMNPHFAASIQVLSLPPQQRRLHSSFYLFTVSKNATPLEIVGLIKDDLDLTLPTESMSTPLKVHDAASGQSIFVSLTFHLVVHDGPMRSILTSTTTSGKASHPCCVCTWGGSQAFKRSAKGLEGFLGGSPPHTAAQTRAHVLEYLDLATRPLAPKMDLSSFVTQTGVVDLVASDIVSCLQSHIFDDNGFVIYRPRPTPEVKSSAPYRAWSRLPPTQKKAAKDQVVKAKEDELRDLHEELFEESSGINPLLQPDSVLDPHSDLPPEPLHVVFLGPVKYLWIELIKAVKKKGAIPHLVTLISSCSHSGISTAHLNPTLWTQYPGMLVGRDLKTVTQLAPYLALLLEKEGLMLERNAWQRHRANRLEQVERMEQGGVEDNVVGLELAMLRDPTAA
ncbi:hypothetical protein JCM5296_000590 [Sporobolomyces johnsonii]